MADYKRIFDQADAFISAIYGKRSVSDPDVWPVLVDADGNLRVNMTVGTVSLSSTASTITNAASNPIPVSLTTTKVTVDNTVTVSGTVTPSTTAATITNAVGNPVNVSLTTTKVTVEAATALPVSLSTTQVTINNAAGNPVNVSLTATKVTVDNTVTVSPTTTAATITNAAGNPVNVSLTSTVVTISNAASNPVNVSLTSTVVTISNTAGTVTNSVSTLMLISKTLTGSTGSLTATNGTVTVTPTNKAKVYAFSLTTTSSTEVICVFHTGGLELWRVTLMAPSGTNAGANLALSPPSFLFASRTGTAVSLSLSTAVLVHYSVSYFDEA